MISERYNLIFLSIKPYLHCGDSQIELSVKLNNPSISLLLSQFSWFFSTPTPTSVSYVVSDSSDETQPIWLLFSSHFRIFHIYFLILFSCALLMSELDEALSVAPTFCLTLTFLRYSVMILPQKYGNVRTSIAFILFSWSYLHT